MDIQAANYFILLVYMAQGSPRVFSLAGYCDEAEASLKKSEVSALSPVTLTPTHLL
jgi:hypothetical protein